MKVVIIGGVAGGATAAARLRRLDERAEIIILERTGYVSYANCGLPYYVGGVITDREELTLQTPEGFRNRFGIDVRVGQEAVELRPEQHTVTVRRLEDGSTYALHYDKLILSPGARPVGSNLPGEDDPRVFTLRTVEDTLRIRAYLDEHPVRRAVVVGGGFIGLEMAENLVHAGVQLRLGVRVSGFSPQGDGLAVELEGGERFPADLVLLGIGVAPDTELARRAGLALGVKGAISVDGQMRTSAPDVYAVGDAVEVRHFVTGAKSHIALAGPANKQGRIAADHICGRRSAYTGALGTSVLKLFDLTAASTGLNEKQARAAGVAYDKVVTYSASHASYYPGARNMTVKTLFDPASGRILGAQIVGFDGVDKRMDVLAAAIRAGLTAEQLTELDLAYAPPYGSAKDPVNMAGYVIENVRAGLVEQHHWDAVAELPADGSVILLDVRTPGEVRKQGLLRSDALHIPLDELRGRLGELDKGKKIYVNCYSGLRSYLACRILSQHGFRCSNLSGGWRFWSYNATDRAHDAAPTHLCGVPTGKD